MRPTIVILLAVTSGCLLPAAGAAPGNDAQPPRPSPVPSYKPATRPVLTGEFPVGIVTIAFRESAPSGDLPRTIDSLDRVNDAQLGDSVATPRESGRHGSGISQAEYFKIYSNGIAWPELVMLPDVSTRYEDEHFFGYYCEFDYWANPFGWTDREEGMKRVAKMNDEALRFVKKSFRGTLPKLICYNYITTRAATPSKELSDLLLHFYQDRRADPGRMRKVRRRARQPDLDAGWKDFDPWRYYHPPCRWGEPMWPNSKIQIHNSAGGVLAHEIGHCLGAPDVYRLDRYNDGISGASSLLAYGPTANAFSRFYHHAYIKQRNHPVIRESGTYTLHPRHITPEADQAVGFLILSNHPHYLYQVEYIHGESRAVGVGPDREGMLISVVNLGRSNYLGSPDYFYVYRPDDPFFRGTGDTGDCLFGKAHRRTEFTMETEPSSRLPNLMDGGVSIRNIEEDRETVTFDVTIHREPVTGSAYTESMLPQIRLDRISNVQPTSFTMDCTIKFRGEPLKTHYGFCWSRSPNPTVHDESYVLAHRECYRGHAIRLSPDTTYYVRAFATNGLGVRYSDEQETVKTPATAQPPAEIEPLTTDSFSRNRYLFTNYSVETERTDIEFIGYSPTCVLAKLVAYYRPPRFATSSGSGSRTSSVNFNQLSWNPDWSDHPPRLVEIDRFFETIYASGRELGFHASKPGKDLTRNLVKLTGVRSKPVLSPLTSEGTAAVSKLIRSDLGQSRPVPVIFYHDSEVDYPVRWALIDGMDAQGRLHVDFPLNSKLLVDGRWIDMETGHYPPEDLIFPTQRTFVITSCFF